MHQTPSQFRRVEHEFLEQFQLKTQQFYDQNVNTNNLIEYKKILNQIKSRRNQKIQKKNKCQWLHKRGNTIDLSGVNENYYQIESNKSQKQQEKQVEQEEPAGFYLTENIWQENIKKNATMAQKQPKQNSISRFQQNSKPIQNSNSQTLLHKSRTQMMSMQHPDNQNLNMDNLNDRIYGQQSVLQCLQHEESQVQEAIFCFKKRIIAMEEQLNSEDIKSKQIDRLLSQNINEMLRAKHTNQHVKTMFLKIKKHFDLDFDGRKQLQVKFGQKNKYEFDQSLVNHIYLKKMKHHISEQEKQLHKLNLYRHELQKKEKKYKSIYLKEQELYKTYEQIKAIQIKDLNKKPIVSILDKEFEEFDFNSLERAKSKKANKNVIKDENSSIKEQDPQLIKFNGQDSKSIKKKLSHVVREIVELYRKMKHYQSTRINEFKQLINERDQKEADYTRTISKISDIYQTLFEQTQPVNLQDKQRLQQLQRQISQITAKNKFLSLSSNGIEYRLKYYLGKQLVIIQKIMDTWMKGDKLTAKYIDSIFIKLYEINSGNITLKGNLSSNSSSVKPPYQQQVEQRQLSLDDSRNLLIGCFENWQEYLGFLDIVHENSYIYRFLTKPKLFKIFKRIIKTKINSKQIPIQQIFQKALGLCFDEGRMTHLQRIQNLLNVFRDIFVYLVKVSNGSIRLNCAMNYDLPVEIRQTESNQHIKAPSRNQLERYSCKKEISLGNDRISLAAKHQIVSQKKESYGNFTETKKFFLPGNMKDEDVISKLKKKKHFKTLLNIHEFYQDLREEIEKVNKISAF